MARTLARPKALGQQTRSGIAVAHAAALVVFGPVKAPGSSRAVSVMSVSSARHITSARRAALGRVIAMTRVDPSVVRRRCVTRVSLQTNQPRNARSAGCGGEAMAALSRGRRGDAP